MPDGVLVTGAEPIGEPGPTIVYVNTAFERDTGYSREELIGKSPWILQGPKTLHAGSEAIRNALINRVSCRVELINYTKRGRECWVEMTITPFFDEGGTVTHFIGFRRDLTQLKQMGAALRRSQEFLEQTGQVARVGGWEIEVETKTLRWTAETYRIHGVALDYEPTVEEAVNFYDPEARDEIKRAVRRCMQDGTPFDLELPFTAADGSKLWVRSQGQAEWADGKVVRVFGAFKDITYEKRVVAARDQALGRLQKLAARVPGMVYQFRLFPDGRCELPFTSEAVRTIYRLTPEQLQSDASLALACHHPDDRDGVIASIRESARDLTPWNHEYRVKYDDGSVRWLLGNAVPERESDGSTLWHGFVTDITERVRVEQARLTAEEAFRESEKRFRSCFELPLLGMAITSPEKGWIEINDQLCCYLGYDRETLQTMNWAELTHPDDLEADVAQFKRLLGGEIDHYTLEKRFICAGGRVMPTELAVGCVRTVDRKVAYCVALIADRTLRHQAQEAMLQSEKKYRSLFDGSRDAILLLEPPAWGFASGNAAAVQLFGAGSVEELVSYGPWDMSPERQPCGELSSKKARAMIQSALNNGSHFFEWVHRRVDGETFAADVLLTRIDQQGKFVLQATVRDITSRKRLEEQLRQAQKLEAVGQLAGGVAHDFNNILSAMMMHLSLLQQNPELDLSIRESLDELLAGAERAAGLTRQLLLFSRQSVMGMKALDLNEVVTNLLKMLGRLIGEQVTIHFTRQEGIPRVKADPGMLEQVLMNLSVNARDAMPGGGIITISLDVFPAEAATPKGGKRPGQGPFVCISVTDTGCGMDEATRGRIFEPFFTTKEPGKGTGLGLATVHGIIGQHKGWVDVESEPGRGTTFRVYLPATRQDRVEPNSAQLGSVPRGHQSILVVEDEAGLRTMVSRVLSSIGYRVVEARDGPTALGLWHERDSEIDLLLTDMVMPGGMSGWQLARRLREQKPDLKVILSSGYSAELGGQTGETLPGVVYLPKPYTMQALSEKVRMALGL